ncbi:unnamed protein product, partial [Effrenium voratum]
HHVDSVLRRAEAGARAAAASQRGTSLGGRRCGARDFLDPLSSSASLRKYLLAADAVLLAAKA